MNHTLATDCIRCGDEGQWGALLCPVCDGQITRAANRVAIELPWSVLESVNQRTNPAGWGKMKGRQFLTAKYRTALDAARMVVTSQTRDAVRPIFPAERVRVTLDFWLPDARRRDCGNYVKLPEDAMTGLVYADDCQIKRLTWEERGIDRERPRVEITITRAAA